MDLVSVFFNQLMSSPAVQSAAMGLLVKVGVDKLKTLFVKLDESGDKSYSVHAQFLVALCSVLASLSDMYLKGDLHSFDPHVVTTFVTTTVPVYLSALGFHLVQKDVKKANAPK